MITLVYIVGALCVLAFIGAWLYDQIAEPTPRVYEKRNRNQGDIKPIAKALNFGRIGEPLAFYGKTKYLKNDPWRLNAKEYTVSAQSRGLVVGISGAGKTSYIVAQINHWARSGRSFVCTDIKPEIWGILNENGFFKKYGYYHIVINPTDVHAYAYNLLDDIDTEQELDEILTILIPAETPEKQAFASFGRTVFKAIILYQRAKQDGKKSVNLVDCYRFLTSFNNANKLLEYLIDNGNDKVKALTNTAKLSAPNDSFVASGFTAITTALDFLGNDTIAQTMNTKGDGWRLKEVLEYPKVALFLQFEQASVNTTSRLFSAMCVHIINILISNASKRDEVFLIYDELLNGGKIQGLTQKFNLIRDYKMPAFIYIQSMAGLYERYGKESGQNFLSSCDFKLCYRVNDINAAKYFSELGGMVEVETITQSQGTNAQGQRTINRTASKRLEPLITPEQMGQLPQGRALCIFKGHTAVIDTPQHHDHTPMNIRPKAVRMADIER